MKTVTSNNLHRHIKEQNGAPPMRPLWYEFPEDAASWTVEGQHLVGDALLVAPVLTKVANFSLSTVSCTVTLTCY